MLRTLRRLRTPRTLGRPQNISFPGHRNLSTVAEAVFFCLVCSVGGSLVPVFGRQGPYSIRFASLSLSLYVCIDWSQHQFDGCILRWPLVSQEEGFVAGAVSPSSKPVELLLECTFTGCHCVFGNVPDSLVWPKPDARMFRLMKVVGALLP